LQRLVERKKKIDLELREDVVSSAQVRFVDSLRLSVDLSIARSAVTIRAESYQVLIRVLFALLPGYYVVNVHIDMPTRRNRATMPCLHKNLPS